MLFTRASDQRREQENIGFLRLTLSANIHSIVSVIHPITNRPRLRLRHNDNASATPSHQLPPYFWPDIFVSPGKQQVQQSLPLILRNVVLVPLREDEEALVP